ncbi:MAG: hypothetical protein U5N56_07275 [Candidatus Marinimicrobia bacterium]|nr:hypothetical protein [Candidatus Neomarinimicrobiota bacterium]
MPRSLQKPQRFINNVLRYGLIVYFIGLAGIIINIAMVINNSGIDAGLDLYVHIWDHRGWTPDLLGVPLWVVFPIPDPGRIQHIADRKHDPPCGNAR